MSEVLDMAKQGTAWLIGKGTTQLNPIHGADLAEYIVDRLEEENAIQAEFPIGGPEILNQAQVAENETHLSIARARAACPSSAAANY